MTEPTPDEIERQRTALWDEFWRECGTADMAEALAECGPDDDDKLKQLFRQKNWPDYCEHLTKCIEDNYAPYIDEKLQDWIDQYPETVKERYAV